MSIICAVGVGTVARPLRHYWSECVGAGRANEGLRAAWQDQLRLAVKECRFRYIRFHGLFHDDMFVLRVRDGKETYNWQYIDELFDFLLETGIRPFVELGFCPHDIATAHRTCFWWGGNGSPPNDYGQWARLVENFARHCAGRYGIEEVKRWYFEVWNEPNLGGFFKGTRQQYYELYRASAQALKKVHPDLRVGGPATSNFIADTRFDGDTEDGGGVLRFDDPESIALDTLEWKAPWVEDFLAFCSREKLPVDFISTQPYPTDFAH
jgi:xylan 1,4-beta-xylosidase